MYDSNESFSYIVTNDHVVNVASSVMVTLTDNKKSYSATIIGTDKLTYLAVLKINIPYLYKITGVDKLDVIFYSLIKLPEV